MLAVAGAAAGSARGAPQPTIGSGRGRLVGLRRRLDADHHAEVDLGRPAAETLDPDLEPRQPGQRVAGPPEQRDRRDDHVAPGSSGGERFELQLDRLRAVVQLDRVEPDEGVVGRARHEIGHPGLARPVRPGHDRERPRLTGRGIPAGSLDRMRTAPVDDLVRQVRDRGECPRAPAEDPVVDLEPAPDGPGQRPATPVEHAIPCQRLADRDDVTQGQPVGAQAVVVAPRVAQVGDDDVAGRPMTAQVDRRRAVDQDPARRASGARPEVEREPVEDLPAGRQAGQGGVIAGIESGRRPGHRRVPDAVEIDRPSPRARAPRQAGSRAGRGSLY